MDKVTFEKIVELTDTQKTLEKVIEVAKGKESKSYFVLQPEDGFGLKVPDFLSETLLGSIVKANDALSLNIEQLLADKVNDVGSFSDEQIRDEYNRRRMKKIRDIYKKRDNYRYFEAKVVSMSKAIRRQGGAFRYDFYLDRTIENHDINSGYMLSQGKGFNLSNMPKVGDTVRLRAHNYSSKKKNMFSNITIESIVSRADS